nr:MAG TPA: hypothetical protein [Caudoviricetes sp.]
MSTARGGRTAAPGAAVRRGCVSLHGWGVVYSWTPHRRSHFPHNSSSHLYVHSLGYVFLN